MTMREGLKREIKSMLSSYYGDVDFWVETMETNNINMITSGTPSFRSYEDARTWRSRLKSIIEELEYA